MKGRRNTYILLGVLAIIALILYFRHISEGFQAQKCEIPSDFVVVKNLNSKTTLYGCPPGKWAKRTIECALGKKPTKTTATECSACDPSKDTNLKNVNFASFDSKFDAPGTIRVLGCRNSTAKLSFPRVECDIASGKYVGYNAGKRTPITTPLCA
jgi:hypothetical protein